MPETTPLPGAVVGAGRVGLAAAARLPARGYEAGPWTSRAPPGDGFPTGQEIMGRCGITISGRLKHACHRFGLIDRHGFSSDAPYRVFGDVLTGGTTQEPRRIGPLTVTLPS